MKRNCKILTAIFIYLLVISLSPITTHAYDEMIIIDSIINTNSVFEKINTNDQHYKILEPLEIAIDILGFSELHDLTIEAQVQELKSIYIQDGFIAPIDKNLPDDAVPIYTAVQLSSIGGEQSEGKYYYLANDIDLNGEWTPINDFRGVLDGQGFSVNGLQISESSAIRYAGMFGEILSGNVLIKNISLNIGTNGINAIITAGGLIGRCGADVFIDNCFVTGNISVKSNTSLVNAGGLIGNTNQNTIINNCYTTGTVSSYSAYSGARDEMSASGGLIGRADKTAIINNSYTSGEIYFRGSSSQTIDCCAGGLVGYTYQNVTITDSNSIGDVWASISFYAYVGGLIGYSNTGRININNCYTTGAIESYASWSFAGGLIGVTDAIEANFAECHATGEIGSFYYMTGNYTYHPFAGGLIGGTGVKKGNPVIKFNTVCTYICKNIPPIGNWDIDDPDLVNVERVEPYTLAITESVFTHGLTLIANLKIIIVNNIRLSKNAAVIAAVYKNDVLTAFWYNDQHLNGGNNYQDVTNLNTNITPEEADLIDNNICIKVFLWDNVSNMIPLAEMAYRLLS